MSSKKRRKNKYPRPRKSVGPSLTHLLSASKTKRAGMKRKLAADMENVSVPGQLLGLA